MGARPPAAAARADLGRVDGIDALRAVAILCVLMNHVNMRLFLARIPYSPLLPAQLVSSLMWSGQYGVQIFFAVSGFLITRNALVRWGPPSQLRIPAFYALRIARIAPLLLALLGVLAICHWAAVPGFVVPADGGGLGSALAAALTFRINVLEAQRGYLPANWDVLWSLSVEEVFYLFFPLLCRWVRPAALWLSCLALFVALGPFARTVLAHGNEVWQEYSYLGGMDAIALGCLSAYALHGVGFSRRSARWMGAAGLAVGACVLGLSDSLTAVAHRGLDMTLIAAATCAIALASARSAWVAPRIAGPFLALGRRSYEIYLTHMFVVLALFQLYLSAGQPPASMLLLFIGCILVSAILGELVARFFSEPMNRLLRRRFGVNACADRR